MSLAVRSATLVFGVGLIVGCNSPEEPPAPPPIDQVADDSAVAQAVHSGSPLFADLADGWNTISPGGDTMCVYGTPYSFFARPADPDKVLISFPGGGACWSGHTRRA